MRKPKLAHVQRPHGENPRLSHPAGPSCSSSLLLQHQSLCDYKYASMHVFICVVFMCVLTYLHICESKPSSDCCKGNLLTRKNLLEPSFHKSWQIYFSGSNIESKHGYSRHFQSKIQDTFAILVSPVCYSC